MLQGYGITGADALDATRAVCALLHGYVALEAAGGLGTPNDVRASWAGGAERVALSRWR